MAPRKSTRGFYFLNSVNVLGFLKYQRLRLLSDHYVKHLGHLIGIIARYSMLALVKSGSLQFPRIH